VTFDGGLSWTELLRLDGDNTSNNGSNAVSVNINERLVSGTATGLSGDGKGGVSFGAVDNPSTGSMQFRWFVEGTNDWWWAIDDILVTGDIVGVPYEGLTDQTVWTFSTPESPRFTLSVDAAAISENGGTATATLSRNAGPLVPDGEVVVSLASSDETELTVPATVTIPAGQLSVTFPVTAVDDGEADRTQTVTIEAVAAPFTSGTTSLLVTDDEGPKVVSVVPGDGLTDVDYRSDLTITFDREVVKGAGIIRLVAAADGEQVVELDVTSADVLVSGATMTITLPDLPGETEYQILMDDGVVVSTSSDLYSGVILMEENFDTLPLLDFADSLVGPDLGDGTDYTFQNPLGFTIDNSLMATGGSSPFEGWSYMDKNSWIAEQGDQSRSKFTLGSGTVAVADGDAWDDYPHDEGYMNSFLITRPIDLTGITPGSVSLEFDSSYYHELPQFASVQVSYDGVNFSPLLFFGDETAPGIGDGSSRNERIVVDSSSQFNDIIGSSIVENSLDNPGFGTLQFMFRYENAGNNWWWAVDNIVIRGERAGEPFAGLEADSWSFTTGPAPTLSVSFDPATIAETGSATGTVTRTVDLASALVVFLASSDPTAATVPATVTIPAGEASATFAITAIDDFVTDGNQETEISVTADGFFSGSATMTVADDDFPQLIAATPAAGATGAAVDGPLTLTFDQNVRAGSGFITIVDSASGAAVESISINSSAVAIVDATVTVTRSVRLAGQTHYHVRIDPAAILATAPGVSDGVPLLRQDFELLPLGPAVTESGGDGTDWTAEPPSGWTVDNTDMPAGGVPEYAGWTFVDKDTWNVWSGQGRDAFTLASGTVAVADTDEFDDSEPKPEGPFNSTFITPLIPLQAVAGGDVTIEFDSSFRPEGDGGGAADGNQTGIVEVSFDGGATWTNLLTQDGDTSDGSLNDASVNRRESLTAAIPSAATAMQVRFGQKGSNDYWWAIDNVSITATTISPPYPGISDTSLAFTTATGSVGNETIVDVGSGQTVTDTTVHAGDAVIVKTGEGTLILDLANSHSGGLRVDAGEVVIRNAAAVNGGPLTVAAGAKLTLDTGVSRIDVSALAVDPAGQIDLGRAGLVIAAGGIDPAELRAAIVAGRNGGTWDGSGGISSTTAAATPGRAVGYAPGGNGTTVVAFAALGDADLNGQVNVLDLVAMDSSGSFNSGGPAEWYQGDFDYSGGTNAFDLIALDSGGAFGAGDYNQAPASALTAAADTGDEQPGPLVPGSKLSVSQMAFASLADEAGKDEEEQWPRIV
jgi:autotransporter-associated beta strand protein